MKDVLRFNRAIRKTGNGPLALGLGVLLGTLGGAALVNAQGGDPNQIRACLLPSGDPASPNVRIVGASEDCARGTPLSWNRQGLPGPPGPPGTPGPSGPQGTPGPEGSSPEGSFPRPALQANTQKLKQRAQQVLVKGFSGLKPLRVVSKSVTNPDDYKMVHVVCPQSHPNVVHGLREFPNLEGKWGGWWGAWYFGGESGPFGPVRPSATFGWVASANVWTPWNEDFPWTLKVTAWCTKK